jgi:hypothetical protein
LYRRRGISRVRFARTGDLRQQLPDLPALDVVRLAMLESRQQVAIQRAPILLPGPLVRLRVELDVVLGQLAERIGLPRRLLLAGGILTLCRGPERILGLLARVRQRQRRVGTKGEPPQAAVMAIKHYPRLPSAVGHPEAEAMGLIVPELDAARRRRLDAVDPAHGEVSRRHARAPVPG